MGEIRVQDEQGIVHVFPDGSTPEMIAKVMNVKPPSVNSGLHPTPENPDPSQPGMRPYQDPLQPLPTAEKAAQTMDSMWEGIKNGAYAIPTLLESLHEAHGAHEIEKRGVIKGSLELIKKGFQQLNPIVPDKGQGGLNRAAESFGNVAGGAMTAELMPGAEDVAAAKRAGTAVVDTAKAVNPRGAMAARMAEKPPGEQFTRQEVLDAARSKGVNLDLAQATGSPVASGIKKATEFTLGGGGSYEANTTKNVTALENWADSEMGKYSKNQSTRESTGSQMQEALKTNLETKKATASKAFQELDKTVGKNKVDVTDSVQAEAQKIVDQNKAYYEEHPELKPKQAWGILEDLARRPTKNVTATSAEFTDSAGNPIAQSSKQVADTKSMSWTELHTLRSDLMDFYRNNPDVVKGRSEAWIQQMVGKIDQAMTTSAGGLSGQDLAQFRHANLLWDSIKSTYDNPQSPLYQAVRTRTPSDIPSSLSNKPEVARQVRETLASLQDGGTVEGAFQRQFVEKLITNKGGALDFKNLDSTLRRTPADVLKAMLGDEGAKQLRILGKVALRVTADSNPSGTAKHVVRTGEVVNAIHNPIGGAAEIGTTYAAGKAMTSPSVVDFLTKKKK